MIESDRPEVKRFWQSFCNEAGTDRTAKYQARTFSDPAMSLVTDEIAELARQGKKKGTAHLLLDFEKNQIPRRNPGDYLIVLNGALSPLCVVQFTAVDVVAFNEVSPEFAASEGEGDLSLEHWASVHKRYFLKQLARWNLPWDESLPLVCESFTLRWPNP